MRSVTATVLTLLLPIIAEATTVVISPSKDNTLFESDNGDQSSGQGVSFFAGRTGINDGDHLRRGLLAFDLAGVIPPGATIGDVTLTLFLVQAGFSSSNRNVSLHTVSANWGEGTSVGLSGNPAAATTGDATWTQRFFPGESWTQAGGDFDLAQSAFTKITGPGVPYLFTGAGLIEDVQNWLDNPGSNFGWILIGDESVQNTALRFASREASVELRPQLTIDYTIPEPSAVATLGLGMLLLSRRRSRSNAGG